MNKAIRVPVAMDSDVWSVDPSSSGEQSHGAEYEGKEPRLIPAVPPAMRRGQDPRVRDQGTAADWRPASC